MLLPLNTAVDWRRRYLKGKASTTFTIHTAFQQTDDGGAQAGTIEPAAITTAALCGIIAETKTTTAAQEEVAVWVPRHADSRFLANVTTGTITALLVGGLFDLDDAGNVDQSASDVDAVQLVKFRTGTLGEFIFPTPGLV